MISKIDDSMKTEINAAIEQGKFPQTKTSLIICVAFYAQHKTFFL